MPIIQDHALQLWTASNKAPAYAFAASSDAVPAYLLLLDFGAHDTVLVQRAREVLTIAVQESAASTAHALNAYSLWQMGAHATCASTCNVYLNLDLLTIDPHAQDWGDFKIKPEQVEVQRDERTQDALFKPRWGFVVQVPKAALNTLMDMLRTAQLVANSTIIGKTWGTAIAGEAVLDVYRDAKKQLNITAQLLLNPARQIHTPALQREGTKYPTK
jgi:hypothetical protein